MLSPYSFILKMLQKCYTKYCVVTFRLTNSIAVLSLCLYRVNVTSNVRETVCNNLANVGCDHAKYYY